MIMFRDQRFDEGRSDWETMRSKGIELLEQMREKVEKIDELEHSRKISPRLAEFSRQLLIMDHSMDEIKMFAENGYHERIPDNLVWIKRAFDGVCAQLAHGGQPQKIGGLIFYRGIPELKDCHRPLFELAKQRRDEYLVQGEGYLLGEAI